MMLPEFLYGAYKRYKNDTDVFASWLLNVTGEGRPLDQANTSQKGSKKDKASGIKTSQTQEARKHKIPLSQFQVLSEKIAAQGTIVPAKVLKAVRRAISGRRRFSDWFQQNASKQDAKVASHAHFVSILERSLAILESVQASSPHSMSTNNFAALDTKPVTLSNTFSNLTVESSTAEDLTSDGILATDSSKSFIGKVVYEFEDANDELIEALFQAHCLLEDLQNLRRFLGETWSEYYAGQLDLMSVSVTTNSAFDIARQQVEDFVLQHPDLDQVFGLSQLMFNVQGMMTGSAPKAGTAGDPYDFGRADAADWCFLPTSLILDAFTRVYTPKNFPVYNGQYGWYEADSDRAKLSPRQKFDSDRALLLQLLPEFAYLVNLKIPLPVEDELTRGIKAMLTTKKVPLWLSFACQMLIDIHNLSGTKVGRGFQDLKLTGVRAQKTLKEHLDFHGNPGLRSPNWPSTNDTFVERVVWDVETFILGDPVVFTGKYMLQQTAKQLGRTREDFFLYRWSPVLSGLLMFNINLRMQELGLTLMNAYGTGIYMAYLYNGIKNQADQAQVQWPDMDFLINLHNEERIFLGQRPKTHEETLKKYLLVMGVAPEAFGTGRRNNRRTLSSKGSRAFEEQSIVSQVFRERFTANGSIDLSIHNIQIVLNDLAAKPALSKTTETKQSSTQVVQARFDKSKRLSPLQLLALLRERMVVEEQSLMLDYFAMHRRNMRLLRLIRSEIHEKLVQYHGPQYLENESQLTNLVGYIFSTAIKSGMAGTQLGLAREGNVGSVMVTKVGKVLQSWQRQNGQQAIKELNAFCRNKPNLPPKGKEREEQTWYWFSLEEVLDAKTVAGLQTGIRH
ncbi:hypothetical protein KVT40_004952 [Elsinoe batatas]|uniref:DUF6604 domain-containing protein n=1 Tax=Elsinoe batatas TaxID=2601811 RepID=A0A8K0L0K1_9PEZI|nr:hypothetical protein KVT40_004952 [Elsinoe batatas]